MARPSRTGGKTTASKTGKTSSVKSRHTGKTKHRIAPIARRLKRSTGSGLGKELKEARAQQAATAEILKVIARSPSDVDPVFEAIATNAKRLLGGFAAAVFRLFGGMVHVAAFTPTNPAADKALRADFPKPVDAFEPLALTRPGEPFAIPDTEEVPHAPIREIARLNGFRSMLFVPLMNGGLPIGVISVTRAKPGTFAPHHVQLLQTFADQAVIAIENVRLFDEVQAKTRDLSESLQQQTATADVLKVISRSAFDLQTVLDALLTSACQLCEADIGTIRYEDGENYQLAATYGCKPEWIRHFSGYSAKPDHSSVFGQTIIGGRTVHMPDVLADPNYRRPEAQKLMGFRAALGVPLIREGHTFGVINLFRFAVGSFEPRQIEIVETFANQAVIAIENVRLFDEVQARTRDLTEALTYQTGSANILKVIASSPTDVAPVLQAIVESACELCGAYDALVRLKNGDGLAFGAHHGPLPVSLDSVPFTENSTAGLAMIKRRPVHVHDLHSADGDRFPHAQELARSHGERTILSVPLLREGESIGAIVLRRTEVHPFSDKQIALLQTFADQAVIAIENARLFNETQEALERQTATTEVLEVINSSPGNLAPVFDAMLEKAIRLCDAASGHFRTYDGNGFPLAAVRGEPEHVLAMQKRGPLVPGPHHPVSRFLRGDNIVHLPNAKESEEYRADASFRSLVDRGALAVLSVALRKDGLLLGYINVYRNAAQSFTDRQIALLQNFASQAVIAMENARLITQTREALEQQTATSDVLKVISRSAFDLQPVFDVIAENAVSLCEAERAFIFRYDGRVLRAVAHCNAGPEVQQFVYQNPIAPGRQSISARAALERRTIHVADVQADPDYHYALRDVGPIRTLLAVPMIKGDELVGVIASYRLELKPFSTDQITLLETFADQAVIAIENARLFNETQEALERQTATAEVLNVINSSPGDLAPVFETILEKAHSLCGVSYGSLQLYDGEKFRAVAAHGIAEAFADRLRQGFVPGPNHPSQQLMQGGRFAQVPDCAEINDPIVRAAFELGGIRTVLFIPLRKEDRLLGQIAAARRDVSSFTEKEISLLENFAAQAVIAIENARLLNETAETLERQTATADILKVIASSPDDVRPVFEAIAQRSKVLVDALSTTVFTLMNGAMHLQAFTPTNRQADTTLQAMFPAALSSFSWGELIRRGEMFCVADTDREPINLREIAQLRGFRSMLLVPLLREQRPIGLISVTRVEPGPFSNHHVQLLQSFADQAVIAIQNVKLFEEVQARTFDLQELLEQQTATSEVLQVISSSSGELDPVFNKMLENATRICGARFGTMTLYEDGGFRTVALYNAPKAYADTQLYKVIRPHPESGLSAVQRTRKPVYIADIRKEPPYVEGNANVRALADLGGARTIIIVPMLRDNELVGTITIYRQEVKPFTDKQTELVSHFANQAVIAIENARLLNELRERTEELSRSLEDLRTAQDRLVQTEKLASLGQLTAGIAHEIKNPLNFVNNFSALSAELVDEMTDVFENPALDEANRRKELDEIRDLLKSNLEKVVQHGKRADSIVKNMLLHSREGSGELRAADINGLVEESLNLAYHGARAEKSGFNITLQREFDTNAGSAELFPQEITRALLNLISNGFYAATKRKSESGEASFEPTLSATTKNLGASVEIRIRDNGTGIPPEVREKMFNPFFTTKPAGEGTGLGLSMTHDIIVKQHGGTIRVDTEPGAFTEFIVTLPRATGVQNIQRSTR